MEYCSFGQIAQWDSDECVYKQAISDEGDQESSDIIKYILELYYPDLNPQNK